MKITMLGVSGSGKTALMSGIHEAFSNNKVNDFYIKPTIRASSIKNIISGDWESISLANNNYEWHPGTVSTTVWDFDMWHSSHSVSEFNWIDYRGGILTDLAQARGSEEEKIELLSHIVLSNALVITIDSFLLTHYQNIGAARQATGVNIIQPILQAYDLVYPNRNLIYIIALTKADAVADQWKRNNYEPLVNRAVESFEILKELTGKNKGWYGGVLPISSVGEGRATWKVVESGTIKKKPKIECEIIDHPIPMNIGHLMFFVVGNVLNQMKYVAQRKLSDRQNEIEDAISKSGRLNDLLSWLLRTESKRDLIARLIEEQNEEYTALMSFSSYISILLNIANKNVRLLR